MQNYACPCCGGLLLRHARHQGLYWYCSSCRQEMPVLVSTSETLKTELSPKVQRDRLASSGQAVASS